MDGERSTVFRKCQDRTQQDGVVQVNRVQQSFVGGEVGVPSEPHREVPVPDGKHHILNT